MITDFASVFAATRQEAATLTDALGAWANIMLAATAVFLLFQGQKDRRKTRDEVRRSQAKRVSIAVQENSVEDEPGQFSLVSRVIRLRNDSDLPVSLSGVSLVEQQSTDTYRELMAGEREAELDFWVSNPEGSLRPHRQLEIEDFNHSWDEALIEFSDASGRSWIRMATTGRLYEHPTGARWWQCAYMACARLPGLNKILIEWPNLYAFWRAKASRQIPFTARWIRFWWGCMPIGEPSAWEMPYDWTEPNDWPYERFLGMAKYEAASKQR